VVGKLREHRANDVSSGVCRSVGEMLDLLLSLTSASIQVVADPTRMRPADVKMLHADANKFRRTTGWAPEISFEQMIGDLLEWRRGQLRRYQFLVN
jgi:GDP-4-dehydro-6-deoxy-D-mannose reductase